MNVGAVHIIIHRIVHEAFLALRPFSCPSARDRPQQCFLPHDFRACLRTATLFSEIEFSIHGTEWSRQAAESRTRTTSPLLILAAAFTAAGVKKSVQLVEFCEGPKEQI